jgi:Icc-related predicted phosphoesterase
MLVGLPGYFNRTFIHASGGCHYQDKDVDALASVVDGATAPAVLVSHGPPRGQGKDALDHAVEAGNVGNEKLTSFLKAKNVKFGIFGHILEAGGRGIDGGSGKFVPPGEWSKSLHINVGSASGTPWQMNDGTVSTGIAMIFEVSGDKARYQVRKLVQQN